MIPCSYGTKNVRLSIQRVLKSKTQARRRLNVNIPLIYVRLLASLPSFA